MKLIYLHDVSADCDWANVIQVLHMCYAFAKVGAEVTLAIPANGSNLVQIQKIIERKIGKDINFRIRPYRKMSFCGKLRMVGGYPAARQVLKTEDADYCFVRNPVLVNAPIRQNMPTIFESHDATIHDNCLWNLLWTRNLIVNCNRSKLVRFIAISRCLADEWIARGVPPEKVAVLHDGVDAGPFRSEPDKKELRNQLLLPQSKKIALYAGSLQADRGVDNVVALAKCFPDVFFLVVGGPKSEASHYGKRCAREQISNIVFWGPVPHLQVRDYLFASDILLLVRTPEGRTTNWCSPLKLFEYMAAGRIIVGQAFSTIKEVLEDGKHAFLADPNSSDDLCEKFRMALSQGDGNIMAKKARELAINNYTWEKRAEAILAHLAS